MVDDDFYMDLAINEAWKYQGLTYPNPAVGSVVVDKNGKILSIDAHKEKGKAHAELEAVKEAYFILTKDKKIYRLNSALEEYEYILNNHNNLFNGFKIYVTLEPCNHFGSTPPCSLLISKLGFKEVIIGSIEENKIATGGIKSLKKCGIQTKTKVRQKECDELLYPFKKWNKERFLFFKIATNLNGSYNTGLISSKASREYVHKLRDKIDLLVIGGNSVRIDRPLLDSRLIGGRAPDILIYSKTKEFDRTIPLFNVKNRKVFVEDNFELIKNYNFIMIEGGEGMLKASQKIVDSYLFFISPNIKRGKSLTHNLQLKTLHQSSLNGDTLLWLTPFVVKKDKQ